MNPTNTTVGFCREETGPSGGGVIRSPEDAVATLTTFEEPLNPRGRFATGELKEVVQMKCESCGMVSDSESEVCPNCGQVGSLMQTFMGAPGTVGPASASGSDAVHHPDPQAEVAVPKLANLGLPPGQTIANIQRRTKE